MCSYKPSNAQVEEFLCLLGFLIDEIEVQEFKKIKHKKFCLSEA